MHFSRAVRSAVAAGLALAVSGAVSAQSTTIDFVNSELDPIPLQDGTAVTIDGSGNIQANCVLDGATCQGVTGGAGAPTVTLGSAKGAAPTVTTGEQLGLTWSSGNSPEVCLARAPASVTAWSGVKAAAGTQNLSFATAGAYALSLECYNDQGSATSAAVNVTVEQGTTPPPPADSCDITSTHPNFQPAGFTPNVLTWAEAFYGQSFPSIKNGGLSPVGSFTFGHTNPGKSMRGQYLAVEFVAPAGGAHGIDWYRSQAVTSRDYRSSHPADAVYVTISPCMGDFRPVDYAAPITDPASSVCRAYKQDGGLSFGTASNGCRLQAGKKYYINIVFSNPFASGGLNPTTDTCASGHSPYCNAIFGSLQ